MDKEQLKSFVNYYHRFFSQLSIIEKSNNDPTNSKFREQIGSYLKVASSETISKNQVNFIDEKEDIFGIGLNLKDSDFLCIDFDYCTSILPIEKALELLCLPKDYEWVIQTGSGLGYHIIVKYDIESLKDYQLEYNSFARAIYKSDGGWVCLTSDDDSVLDNVIGKDNLTLNILKNGELVDCSFKTNKYFQNYFEKIELIDNKHCLLPLSIHKSGNHYNFINNDLPNSAPSEISASSLYFLIADFCLEDGEILQNRILSFSLMSDEDYSCAMEQLKNEKLFVIFDIETTGLIKNEKFYGSNFPEIIQIAWIVTDGKQITYFESSLNSEIKSTIPEEITRLTGIDNMVCKTVGRPLSVIAEMILQDLKSAKTIISYNLDFDIEFLKNLFFKTNKPVNFKNYQHLCLMKSAFENSDKIKDYDSERWLRLDVLYKKIYPQSNIQAHNAVADVLMAYKIFRYLKNLNE